MRRNAGVPAHLGERFNVVVVGLDAALRAFLAAFLQQRLHLSESEHNVLV